MAGIHCGLLLLVSLTAPFHPIPGIAPSGPSGIRLQEPPDPVEQAAIQAARMEIQALFERRQFVEATKAAAALTRQYPKNPEAWMTLATCHLRDDWPMRSDSRAEQSAERALKLAGPRPDILFALAVARYRQRRPETMETVQTLLGQAAESLPPDRLATLLHIRAVMLLNGPDLTEEQQRQAWEDLDRAIELLPRAAHLRIERARQRRLRDDYPGAVADLAVAEERDPGSVTVHYELKTCYVALRDMDRARHHLEVWQLLQRLTDSVARTSAPDPAERVQVLRRLRELNPRDAQRRLDYVVQEMEHGDVERAAAELQDLRRDFPAMPGLTELERQIQQRRKEQGTDGG